MSTYHTPDGTTLTTRYPVDGLQSDLDSGRVKVRRGIRAALTYRGNRRNADRAGAPCHRLRFLRRSMGLTRREFDRMRDIERRQAVEATA